VLTSDKALLRCCSHYGDVCSLLDALFPTDRHCPRLLRRHRVRCRCPFDTGLLDLARYSVRVPRFSGFMKTLAVVSCRSIQLVASHSGRTAIFRRRTFPVLRSTCISRVTTYVGKPSAAGQPTRPTQPFILSGSIMSSKLFIGCVRCASRSGGAIW